MTLKWRVLSALNRDDLLEVARALELDVTTLMTVDEPREALAACKRAKLAAIVREPERLGVEPTVPVTEGAFARGYTRKDSKQPVPTVPLPLRGAGAPR